MSFRGCKLVLKREDQLLTYKRDDYPFIAHAGKWDLPGGGREPGESPEECVLRELEEEFGLRFDVDRLLYRRRYDVEDPDGTSHHSYFFGGVIHPHEIESIVFGGEGQFWEMMDITTYLQHDNVLDRQKARVRDYLEWLGDA